MVEASRRAQRARTATSSSDPERPRVTLRRLAREPAAVRAELSTLRAELAAQVRTRRMVIVDDDGHERISSTVGPMVSMIEIHAPAVPGAEPAHVALAASMGTSTWPGVDEVAR